MCSLAFISVCPGAGELGLGWVDDTIFVCIFTVHVCVGIGEGFVCVCVC